MSIEAKRNQGVETVGIKNFNPEKALEFLKGWEVRPRRLEPGWEFIWQYKGAEISIAVDPNNKRVTFNDPATSDQRELEDVEKVELNYDNQQLTFEGKGGSYKISDEGKRHYFRSKDRKMSATRVLKT